MKLFFCGQLRKPLFLPSFFVIWMLAAFSCSKKLPVNLIGRWESNIRYEQELAELFSKHPIIPLVFGVAAFHFLADFKPCPSPEIFQVVRDLKRAACRRKKF